MKQKGLIAILIMVPLLLLGALFWFLHVSHTHPSDIANHDKVPLEFKDNTVQCPQCHMYLVGKTHTAQVVDKRGKTHFFDDIGCVILWLRDEKIAPEDVVIWVFSLDTKRYIHAKEAFYSLNERTPMEYGFGAYEAKTQERIPFEQMRLHMLRGETMQDPRIRKQRLGE